MLIYQLSIVNYQFRAGRFTSTDVLFGKYPGWSPYQYSMNNPVNLLDWNGKEFNYSNLNREQKEFVKNYLGIIAKKGEEGMNLYNKLKYTDVKIMFKEGVGEGGYGTAYETKIKDYDNKSGIEEIDIGVNFQKMEDDNLTADKILKVITEECVHAEQLIDSDKQGKLKELIEERAFELNLPYDKRDLENEAKLKVDKIVNSSYK